MMESIHWYKHANLPNTICASKRVELDSWKEMRKWCNENISGLWKDSFVRDEFFFENNADMILFIFEFTKEVNVMPS